MGLYTLIESLDKKKAVVIRKFIWMIGYFGAAAGASAVLLFMIAVTPMTYLAFFGMCVIAGMLIVWAYLYLFEIKELEYHLIGKNYKNDNKKRKR